MKPMKTLMLSAGVFALGLATFPLAAHADTGSIAVNSINPGTIEVVSDGSTYTATAVPLISLTAQLAVQLDAEFSGKVKSWKAWTKVKKGNGPWIQFSNDYDSASYAMPRPKTVNTVAVVNVPFGTIGPFATGQCNALANTLRGQGKTNEYIFGQDRNIVFDIEGALSYEMTGAASVLEVPSEVVDSYKKLNVLCKASPQPEPEPINPTRSPHGVDQATLTIQGVSTMNGACKLNLSGVIQSKEANKQVKFRYKDDDGHQSDIKTVMTDHAKTVMFNHQYDLAGTGAKTGKIRIDIEGETVNSPWSNYNVHCNANAPGGLSGNDTVRRTGVGDGAADGFASPTRPNTAPTAGNGGIKANPARPTLKKAQ